MRQVVLGLLVGWLVAALVLTTVILAAAWRARRDRQHQATRLEALRGIAKGRRE